VGLERSLLSLVSTTEELLGRKSSGSRLENRNYGRRQPAALTKGHLYQQKLALTSPTSASRSVGIVRSQTQVTEFVLFVHAYNGGSKTFSLPGAPGRHIALSPDFLSLKLSKTLLAGIYRILWYVHLK
jgi:hypothetical protein